MTTTTSTDGYAPTFHYAPRMTLAQLINVAQFDVQFYEREVAAAYAAVVDFRSDHNLYRLQRSRENLETARETLARLREVHAAR